VQDSSDANSAEVFTRHANGLESDRDSHAGDLAVVSEQDRERADRVARRLHGELRGLIRRLPEPDRGASALARILGVDRTTCQRVVSAVEKPFPGPVVLSQVPGVRGLQQFIDGMRTIEHDASAVDSAEAAVESFAELIQDLGGSQTRLVKRLASVGVVEKPGGPLEEAASEADIRRRLFDCGVQLCGQYSQVSIATFVFRPTPGAPTRIDMAQLRGFIGHRMRPDAMPFSVQWWVDPDDADRDPREEGFRTLDRTPIRGRSQGVLLEEFSSHPAPAVTSRGPSDQRVMLIDPASAARHEKFDVVTAGLLEGAQVHPAHDAPPMHEVWMLGRFPTRTLIFDVLLHRSMARACIPGVGRYVISPALNESMERRWLDRFPGGPRLQILEPGITGLAHRAYPRYPEAMGVLFDRIGWDPGDYITHRCEVDFPQWGAGYCMSFDYAREEPEEKAPPARS
jgi:hypothetical protein